MPVTPQNQHHKTDFISQHPPHPPKAYTHDVNCSPAHFKHPSECHSSLSLFVHKCDVEHRLHSSPCSPRDPWILAFLPPFLSGLYTVARAISTAQISWYHIPALLFNCSPLVSGIRNNLPPSNLPWIHGSGHTPASWATQGSHLVEKFNSLQTQCKLPWI